MLRVALTGGIASGKSLVADRFERLGAALCDADRASRAVVAPGSRGLSAVTEAFGTDVLGADGTLDRAALRRRVFADDDDRKRLEAILHPLIREHMEAELDRARAAGHAYAVSVIPLLVETGQFERHDRVLVVDAPDAIRRERLCARDGLSAPEADRVLASQTGRWERLQRADDVVANGDAVAASVAIDCQVLALDRKYRAFAAVTA